MKESIVKVAYVTKWAGPILVVKDFRVSKLGALTSPTGYGGHFYVDAKHWTEDRDLAEDRWRINRNKEIKAAERKLNAAAKALRDGPTWEER